MIERAFKYNARGLGEVKETEALQLQTATQTQQGSANHKHFFNQRISVYSGDSLSCGLGFKGLMF